MIKNFIYLTLLCGVFATAGEGWISSYVTNKMEARLSPYPLTICSSIKMYRNSETNVVAVSELNSGDKLLILFDIPREKMTNEPSMTNTSKNIVGYMLFTIPSSNTPPILTSFLQVR